MFSEQDLNTMSPEEMRAAMIRQINEQGGEIMNEIAMPGVVCPVSTDEK